MKKSEICPVCVEKLHLNAFDLIIIGDVFKANVSQYVILAMLGKLLGRPRTCLQSI